MFAHGFVWNAWGLMAMVGVIVGAVVTQWSSLTEEKNAALLLPILSYNFMIGLNLFLTLSGRHHHRGLAFGGMVLFAISDSLIFLNKFMVPIPFAHVAIHLLYYASQWLMVVSVVAFPSVQLAKKTKPQ